MIHDLKKYLTPSWIKDEGIVISGGFEPITFQRRRGRDGLSVNAHEKHFSRFSKDNLKRLKKLGYNVIIVSGVKGAGYIAEKEDIENSKEVAEDCHELGLKIGTYIGDTIFSETLFDEFPEAENWAVVDWDGKVCHYNPYQAWRFIACKNNPDYIAFKKENTRFCIEEIGVDYLHYDNVHIRPEPQYCRCIHCVRLFNEFVKNKYNENEFLERFGFSGYERIKPPYVIAGKELWRNDKIEDPLLQDWVEFQCETLSSHFGQITQYAKSLKPDIVMEANCGGVGPYNPALRQGVNHSTILPYCDVLCIEDQEYAHITEKGDLQSRIRTYKVAKLFNQIVWGRQFADSCDIAETLAFNSRSMSGLDLSTAANAHILNFWLKNREFFIDTSPIIDASVLYHFQSRSYFLDNPAIQARLAEQAIIQSRIGWSYVFDNSLNSFLASCKVLVLPDVISLSDEQIETISKYVEKGMGLVVTGQTSLKNLWARNRDSMPLGELWGETNPSYNMQGIARRNTFGQGRVVYLPKLETCRTITGNEDTQMPDRLGEDGYLQTHTYQLPANWREFAEAIEWAGNGLSIKVDAPKTVIAETVLQEKTGRLMIHLVNYEPRKEVSNIRIRISKKIFDSIPEVKLLTYDSGKRHATCQTLPSGDHEIKIDWLGSYAMLVFNGKE
jgi:hypothetical protein